MKWWLITWTTYGSWLPGDPRGFQTWRGHEYVPPPARYARAGETPYRHAEYADRYAQSRRIVKGRVSLTCGQREQVQAALIEEMAQLPIEPAALSVDHAHVHFLARFGASGIRATVGRLKAAATRTLHRTGLRSERVWSRNCHMKSLVGDEAFKNAVHYIVQHREQGALVHIWNVARRQVVGLDIRPQADDLSSESSRSELTKSTSNHDISPQ